MAVAVLMPAYDEGEELVRTIAELRTLAPTAGPLVVFVVDDGSARPIDASSLGAPTDGFSLLLARHPINLGQGAALETARQMAIREPVCSAYVTMDADGQHRPADAFAVARAVEGGVDVAFGNRFLGASNVPPGRRALLRGALMFERALTGLPLADAHNGLRAFSRRALEIIELRQNRMAHATEIKQLVRRERLSYVEVPVSVRYSKETIAKGQRGVGAADIVRDLLARYLFGDPS